jgi:hypothetical protein
LLLPSAIPLSLGNSVFSCDFGKFSSINGKG